MSLDGITYANKSLILKIQLYHWRAEEEKIIYFKQCNVDSGFKSGGNEILMFHV